MANRAYIGDFVWGAEVVTIPTLAIISREIFDAVLARRAINKSESKRNVKYDYLLRGRLTCTCGRKMKAVKDVSKGHTYLYYQCNRKAFDPSPACDRKRIQAGLADHVVWNWLVDVFRNPEKLLVGLREYAARQRDKAAPQRARLAELPGLISDCEAQARRLSKSLERVPEDDELTARNIEANLGQISAAHKRYTAERDKITAELAAAEVGEADIQQLLAWAAEINTAINDDTVSFEAQQAVIDRLNVTAKIEYQNNERGLWIDCPVLSYASKWQILERDCIQSLSNDLSAHHHCADSVARKN
jgi:hypothetical protein